MLQQKYNQASELHRRPILPLQFSGIGWRCQFSISVSAPIAGYTINRKIYLGDLRKINIGDDNYEVILVKKNHIQMLIFHQIQGQHNQLNLLDR